MSKILSDVDPCVPIGMACPLCLRDQNDHPGCLFCGCPEEISLPSLARTVSVRELKRHRRAVCHSEDNPDYRLRMLESLDYLLDMKSPDILLEMV